MRHEGRMCHVEDHRVERRPSCACDGGGRPELRREASRRRGRRGGRERSQRGRRQRWRGGGVD
eukprot:1969377-Rhodomonas_salina.1